MNARLILLAFTLALSGCTTAPSGPLVSRSVEAYASPSSRGGSLYLLAPLPETGLTIGDPVTDAYLAPLHATLATRGFKPAGPNDSADLLIVFSFSSDTVRHDMQQQRPIVAMTGGAQFHNFSVPTAQGMKLVTGTTYTPTRFTTVGSSTYTETKTFRRGWLVLSAFEYPIAADAKRVWVAGSSIVGEDLPGGPALAALLARQVERHIGTNIGQISGVDASGVAKGK